MQAFIAKNSLPQQAQFIVLLFKVLSKLSYRVIIAVSIPTLFKFTTPTNPNAVQN